MLWQQAAGFSFAMPGGYFIGPGNDGHAYVAGQPSATGSLFRDVERDGQVREVTPEMRAAFAADIDRWGACTAVLGPAANPDALRDQATALIGAPPEQVDGVLLWRDLSRVPGR
jgi:dolichyl-phosphate beta-glucosyltransferase